MMSRASLLSELNSRCFFFAISLTRHAVTVKAGGFVEPAGAGGPEDVGPVGTSVEAEWATLGDF